MTGGVATNCDQIGKDITIWLKLGQQQMESDEKKKEKKIGGDFTVCNLTTSDRTRMKGPCTRLGAEGVTRSLNMSI